LIFLIILIFLFSKEGNQSHGIRIQNKSVYLLVRVRESVSSLRKSICYIKAAVRKYSRTHETRPMENVVCRKLRSRRTLSSSNANISSRALVARRVVESVHSSSFSTLLVHGHCLRSYAMYLRPSLLVKHFFLSMKLFSVEVKYLIC